MLKAVCSTSRTERHDVEDSVELTFPISFELADDAAERREPAPTPSSHGDSPAPLSDAMREMMAWSPWTASPPVRSEPRVASGRAVQPQGDDQWQMRVEMTLDDAEALVEGLCSLIAVAKENAIAHQAATSPALAFAGTKIGADYKAAPPRFSSAQLEALSRKPARRRLEVEQDGRLVHQLFASGRMERRFPS
jgi:hypothetical protein